MSVDFGMFAYLVFIIFGPICTSFIVHVKVVYKGGTVGIHLNRCSFYFWITCLPLKKILTSANEVYFFLPAGSIHLLNEKTLYDIVIRYYSFCVYLFQGYLFSYRQKLIHFPAHKNERLE